MSREESRRRLEQDLLRSSELVPMPALRAALRFLCEVGEVVDWQLDTYTGQFQTDGLTEEERRDRALRLEYEDPWDGDHLLSDPTTSEILVSLGWALGSEHPVDGDGSRSIVVSDLGRQVLTAIRADDEKRRRRRESEPLLAKVVGVGLAPSTEVLSLIADRAGTSKVRFIEPYIEPPGLRDLATHLSTTQIEVLVASDRDGKRWEKRRSRLARLLGELRKESVDIIIKEASPGSIHDRVLLIGSDTPHPTLIYLGQSLNGLGRSPTMLLEVEGEAVAPMADFWAEAWSKATQVEPAER